MGNSDQEINQVQSMEGDHNIPNILLTRKVLRWKDKRGYRESCIRDEAELPQVCTALRFILGKNSGETSLWVRE